MKSWNFVLAAVFIFVAVTLLTGAVGILSHAQHAQILVAPDFGQVADQAWDNWRDTMFRFFDFWPF